MSAPRAAIRPAEAVEQLAWLLTYQGGEAKLPIYINGGANPYHVLPSTLDSCKKLARMARELDFHENAEVAVGLPQIGSFVYSSTILWAWISGTTQEQLAAKFRPQPSIVLKIGDSRERLLIWALRKPLAESFVDLFNARIAYRLQAPRTRSKATALRLPLPGTFMRAERRRPAPILVTRWELEDNLHTGQEIAAQLREPPPKDAWKEAKKRAAT